MKLRGRYLAGVAGVLVVAIAAAVGLFLGLHGGSGSGGEASANDPVVTQYSAKFICGSLIGQPDPFATAGVAQPLAPGVYHTDINVHNSSNPFLNLTPPAPATVYVQKKVVVTPLDVINLNGTPSQFEIVGSPTQRERLSLQDDQAFEIDCAAINDLINKQLPAGQVNPCAPTSANPNGFCKGYVVIEAATQVLGANTVVPAQLDVTNVVTLSQQPGPTTQPQPVSLDFEYVTGKRIFYPCWSNTATPPCP